MSSPDAIQLQKILCDTISREGAIGVDHFMSLVLGHPEYGYYMRRDPFGVQGDFITAPEISQLFGEMIGIWLVDMWMQMGQPEPFILLEAGPGRGTLMADILRVSKEFCAAAQIHLLEMSPVLGKKQKAALGAYKVNWHTGFSSVPDHAPIFFVANEFFDALPFRQFVYRGLPRWCERKIELDSNYKFTFVEHDCGSFDPVAGLNLSLPEIGKVVEISSERAEFMAQLARKIKVQNGAGLIIDYGHKFSGYGNTFQALYKHTKVDVLSHIGDADFTSHVDFAALKNVCTKFDIEVSDIIGQGDFLRNIGIYLRAEHLAKNASAQQRGTLEKSLHRLTYSGEMGTLFKVMGIYSHANTLNPAGFN